MKAFALTAIIVACVSAVGCEHKPAEKVDGKADGRPGIEVNAPGVHVDIGHGKGVEVQAPGVEIQTRPKK